MRELAVPAGSSLPNPALAPLVDTHCHLDSGKFDADRLDVLERAGAAGVTRIVSPATSVESSRRVIALAEAHPQIYAALGVHPTEVAGVLDGAFDEIRRLAANPKVVGLGEIGLDYYWVTDAALRTRQQTVLQVQLDLAKDLKLPVVLHMRNAEDVQGAGCERDLMVVLERWIAGLRAANHALAQRPGVLHSFSGSWETAKQAVEMGLYIGVTGPVTYKRATARQKIISQLPLESLLLETDAPYLAPEPHRGRRNEPAFLARIADKIAELHSRSLPEVAAVTNANAARLFAWGETT